MIVKKLRQRKHWSQEHLAELTGLSTRTIQRIETGCQASLESLKALAAVFEVEIAQLTEEITVIDRKTEQWKALPYWKRVNIWGIKSRSQMLKIEYTMAAGGLVLFVAGIFIDKLSDFSAVLMISAYLQSLTIRDLDKREIW